MKPYYLFAIKAVKPHNTDNSGASDVIEIGNPETARTLNESIK